MEMKDRIAEAVESTGLTNVAFAKRMGKSKGVVTQWLDGRIKSLKAETAQAMQDVTGYRSEWLISGKGGKLLHPNTIDVQAVDVTNRRALPQPADQTGGQTPADYLSALVSVFATAPESTRDTVAMLAAGAIKNPATLPDCVRAIEALAKYSSATMETSAIAQKASA